MYRGYGHLCRATEAQAPLVQFVEMPVGGPVILQPMGPGAAIRALFVPPMGAEGHQAAQDESRTMSWMASVLEGDTNRMLGMFYTAGQPGPGFYQGRDGSDRPIVVNVSDGEPQ